jgi:hypothetical protein
MFGFTVLLLFFCSSILVMSSLSQLSLSDISEVSDTSDWWLILLGILFVDTVIILAARYYPNIFGSNLNIWYDKFGLSAVLADVLIIALGFAIARYIYTFFFKDVIGWSPLYFLIILVLVQMIHDILFYLLVIVPIPRGENAMMDVFKDYARGGAKIIAGDAGLMIGSALSAMVLKSLPSNVAVEFGLLVLYTLPYALYTNTKKK